MWPFSAWPPDFWPPGYWAGMLAAAEATPAGVSATTSLGQVIAVGTTPVGVRPPVVRPLAPLVRQAAAVLVRGMRALARLGRPVAVGAAQGRPDLVATAATLAQPAAVRGAATVAVEGLVAEAASTAPRAAGAAGVVVRVPVPLAPLTLGAAVAQGTARARVVTDALVVQVGVVILDAPDPIDLAWTQLQREQDDEEALLALGVFDV